MRAGIGIGLPVPIVPPAMSVAVQPPLTGLKLWLRADAGAWKDAAKTQPAISNGDAVYTWADQSGNGNDAVQATLANRPVIKLPAINGLPSLNFTLNEHLVNATLSLSQPFTIVAHGYLAIQATYLVGFGSNASAVSYFFHSNADEWVGFIGNSGFIGNAPMIESSYKLWTFIIDSLNSTIKEQDRVIRGPGSGNISAAAFNGIVIGGRNTGANPYNGEWTEFLVYDSHLSATDLLAAQRYLMRWDYTDYKIMPIGDSKTAGTGDGNYISGLISNLTTATGNAWRERPYRYAFAGATLASGLAAYQATPYNISAANYILMNYGANDVPSLPSQATWTANLVTYLDLLHQYNPDAQIYIMRPWRRNYAAECNSIATWIANAISGLSYAHLGPDERVFLENGDNGVTYTADGVHPNTAGYALTVTQWQTVMGF